MLLGVGLIAFAGYLISRSAERPPVLSLTVVIVAVRFFGLARPVSRYCERLAAHDLAFRLLARMRVAFFTRLEPLVPARSRAIAGATCWRAWSATSMPCRTSSCAASRRRSSHSWPAPCRSRSAPPTCRPPAWCSPPACSPAGVVVPVLAALAGRRSGARQAGARAELMVELVELLRGAPELAVLGAEGAALERVAALDAELTRLARSEAVLAGLIEGLAAAIVGLTVAGVLVVCVAATPRARSTA